MYYKVNGESTAENHCGHYWRRFGGWVWQGCRVVAGDEVFLMNWQSRDSLDGRYFGLLPASTIAGRADPLWTREED